PALFSCLSSRLLTLIFITYSFTLLLFFPFFFFNTPPTTDIYTLSLHDALPISARRHQCFRRYRSFRVHALGVPLSGCANIFPGVDRKSTRLNSSHVSISYAVFCLKKKKKKNK